ncbi:GNAT family N-acetyltransferase [Microbacterium sp. GCS4]|uniref:GNAT family N-acetyltransferase n=1 Tax=Microbacterium sp. GCS4 TaxID=1692239 RepID=UPI000681119B|nr:GNAT family N-acetyltransferase [Microbacterium sp. GCS4]
MTEVRIERAALESAIDLARLKWLDAEGREPTDPELRAFTQEMTSWWAENGANHSAYIARSPSGQAIGAAWLALVPRVPRPGNLRRLSADVQSVYVVPTSRGQGVGSMLVEAARAAAVDQGAPRIVVHSSERAVPLYRRLGFAISERLLQRHHDS